MTPFLQLVFSLMVIITAAKAGGWLAVRLRQPAVLGELLVGVLLGPSLLDLLHWPLLANAAEPHLLTEAVYELAELGVICLMFLAGLEVDVREMRRTGRVAVLAGVSGVIVPLALGALAVLPFGYHGQAALFVGMILTATSVSISAQTLLELGVLRSKEGIALLGAAVVDDVLVILLLSIFVAVASSGAGAGAIALVLVRMLLYLGLAIAAAFLVLPRLADWIDDQPISEGLTALVLVVTLGFAWFAEVGGGLAAITGAFIAGLGFGRSRLHSAINRSMHTITYAFLVPIFFVSIGLKTNARLLDRVGPPAGACAGARRRDRQSAGRRRGRAAGRLHESLGAARGRGNDQPWGSGPDRRQRRGERRPDQNRVVLDRHHYRAGHNVSYAAALAAGLYGQGDESCLTWSLSSCRTWIAARMCCRPGTAWASPASPSWRAPGCTV